MFIKCSWSVEFDYFFKLFNDDVHERQMKPVKANIADADQMPHNVASDQGLYCLLTGFFIKNRVKVTK